MDKLFEERLRKMNLIVDNYSENKNQEDVASDLEKSTGVKISPEDISKVSTLNDMHYDNDLDRYNPRKELIKPSIMSEDLEFLDKYNI